MCDNRFKSITGSILIELMISVAIGFLLISGLTEIYLSASRATQLQKKLIDVQTSAQSVITILHDNIKHAGFIGCAALTSDFPIVSHVPFELLPQTKLVGGDNQITVRYADYPSANVIMPITNHSQIVVNNVERFKADDIMMISDCMHAEIAKVVAVSHQANKQVITLNAPLQYLFQPNADVSRLVENTFYRCHQSSLCVRDVNNIETELVENVRAINFMYSLWRENKLVDLPASAITDWSLVVGVTINLQMGTAELTKPWHDYVALGKS